MNQKLPNSPPRFSARKSSPPIWDAAHGKKMALFSVDSDALDDVARLLSARLFLPSILHLRYPLRLATAVLIRPFTVFTLSLPESLHSTEPHVAPCERYEATSAYQSFMNMVFVEMPKRVYTYKVIQYHLLPLGKPLSMSATVVMPHP